MNTLCRAYAATLKYMRAGGTHYGPTRIYGPTGHAIGGDGTADTTELNHRCHHRRAAPPSATIASRLVDEPRRRRRRRGRRDSLDSVVGRMEQLADVGRSDPAARGLNDHATFGERADESVRHTGLGYQ